MNTYTFDVTLSVTIDVDATSEAAARGKLREHIDGADAYFGIWSDSGYRIFGDVSMAPESPVLMSIDGEEP